MRSRSSSTLAVSIAAIVVALLVPRAAAVAQDQTTFRVLQAVGTPDEKPLMDAITSRARLKFTGDREFVARVNDAMLKRDFTTAAALIATAIQVRADQVSLGSLLKRVGTRQSRDDYFRLASMPMNPFYILITTENHAICFGLKSICIDAMRKAGYEPSA